MTEVGENTVSAEALELAAPAKINLALHVVGQRPGDRHLLQSLVVFARFGDRLLVRPSGTDRLELRGPYASSLEPGDSNLVCRARDLLRARFSARACPPVSIRLEKNIPVAAGVGGGSSDAAATLRALARLWQLPVSAAQFAETALELGADVPMCLAAGPLIATGIGEDLTRLAGFPSLHMVLVHPQVPLQTRDVFAALASKRNPELPPLPKLLTRSALLAWLSATRNDLQEPALALAPEVGLAVAALAGSGAGLARMSGSGTTCFGIYDDGAGAAAAARQIADSHPDWLVVATGTGGSDVDLVEMEKVDA